jgi:hypothetical protein
MSIISDSASDTHDLTHKCSACGTEWIDHRGPTSLCERIQECKRIITDLLHYIEQPDYSRDIGEMESYFDTIEDAEIILKEF